MTDHRDLDDLLARIDKLIESANDTPDLPPYGKPVGFDEPEPTRRGLLGRVLARILAVLLIATALLAGCKTPDQATNTPAPSVSHQPLEDQPGWDCHTMGNRHCGPEDPRA